MNKQEVVEYIEQVLDTELDKTNNEVRWTVTRRGSEFIIRQTNGPDIIFTVRERAKGV